MFQASSVRCDEVINEDVNVQNQKGSENVVVSGLGMVQRGASIKRRSLIQTIMLQGDAGVGDSATHSGDAKGGATSGIVGQGAQVQKDVRLGKVSLEMSRSGNLGLEDEKIDDVSVLLQTLATQEQELFEQRKTVEDLRRQLRIEELHLVAQSRELEEQKLKVSRALDPNYGGSRNNEKSALFTEESVRSRPRRHHSMLRYQPNSWQQPRMHRNSQQRTRYTSADQQVNGVSQDRKSRILETKSGDQPIKCVRSNTLGSFSFVQKQVDKHESVWAKSLSFFNEFDQLLQDGFDKKLGFEDLISSSDMLGTSVSNQWSNAAAGDKTYGLWGFVQDLKTGLLGLGEVSVSSEASKAPGASELLPFNVHKHRDVGVTNYSVKNQYSMGSSLNDGTLSFIKGKLDTTEVPVSPLPQLKQQERIV